MKYGLLMKRMDVHKMVEIQIEIDADLLEQLNKVIEPMGITPEWLAEQFIYFCADPNNKERVKEILLDCKE